MFFFSLNVDENNFGLVYDLLGNTASAQRLGFSSKKNLLFR